MKRAFGCASVVFVSCLLVYGVLYILCPEPEDVNYRGDLDEFIQDSDRSVPELVSFSQGRIEASTCICEEAKIADISADFLCHEEDCELEVLFVNVYLDYGCPLIGTSLGDPDIVPKTLFAYNLAENRASALSSMQGIATPLVHWGEAPISFERALDIGVEEILNDPSYDGQAFNLDIEFRAQEWLIRSFPNLPGYSPPEIQVHIAHSDGSIRVERHHANE